VFFPLLPLAIATSAWLWPGGSMVAEEADAFVIAGAGFDDANGLYTPTGKMWHGAPVYENDRKCLLSREPHKDQKKNLTSYGWIIGQDRKPLYAIKTEAMVPPASGWKRFEGSLPMPQVKGCNGLAAGALEAAKSFKEQGNGLFNSRRYDEADAVWTRALGLNRLLQDETIQVALYSNRSEARLRMERWEGALMDAKAALQKRPTHDKALLRAAVAARELRRLDIAQDFVLKCLEAHPKQPEARQLLMDIDQLIASEQDLIPSRARDVRKMLRESALGKSNELLDETPKAFDAKDQNSLKGFKAFKGYSNNRTTTLDRVPLQSLPYHNMGLAEEEVKKLDDMFQEVRNKRDEKLEKKQRDKEKYAKVREEYRMRTQEDIAEGRAPPLEKVMKSVAAEMAQQRAAREVLEQQQELAKQALADKEATGWSRQQAPQKVRTEPAELSTNDAQEIDALFAGYFQTNQQLQVTAPSGEGQTKPSVRQERLAKARAIVSGAASFEPRPKEQVPDEKLKEKIRTELQVMYVNRHGEPSRLEQTAVELRCWWTLPTEVGSGDVSVKCTGGGSSLLIQVLDTKLFDQPLFAEAVADEVTWSVEDGELHVLIPKSKTGKEWKTLGAR